MIAGLDPYVGFLHRDDYNQKSMVFDFIEPYRIFVETAVFRLFAAKKVNKAHVDEITNGVTLNKEGKELLVTALNNYMENTIRYKGRNQRKDQALQSSGIFPYVGVIQMYDYNQKSMVFEFIEP